MQKRVLIKKMGDKFPDMPPSTVASMTDKIFALITAALSEGNRVEIRNFGTFFVRTINPRMLRNPRTGDAVEVPAKQMPRFKAGQRLRDKANHL